MVPSRKVDTSRYGAVHQEIGAYAPFLRVSSAAARPDAPFLSTRCVSTADETAGFTRNRRFQSRMVQIFGEQNRSLLSELGRA